MNFILISFIKPDVRKTLKINFSGYKIASYLKYICFIVGPFVSCLLRLTRDVTNFSRVLFAIFLCVLHVCKMGHSFSG